ncbi:MAG: DUF3488 domain-containing protein [Acidobacteria bacterium]|nr:DUF3488 domain-containing protein [Acidobacteriota bacterium]
MKFERLFKIASYGVFLNGFLALAFTGAVELTGILLYALVLVISWWWDERKNLLPVRVQNLLILAYLGFYLLDLLYLSLPILATVHLVFFVSAIKLFSQKSARDYLFLYLFSFAQLLIATSFTINILFLLHVFLFLLFGIACLALHEIFSAKQDRADRTVAHDFWSAGSFFGGAALVAVTVCIVAMPFFFILPRFQGSFLGSAGRGEALSGFSDHVNLGDIGRIKLNSAVVMRVKVNRALGEIPANLKWRGVSLSYFDGSGWTRGVEKYSIAANISGGYQVGGGPYQPGDLLQQIFVIEPESPAILFHAPRLISVSNEVQNLLTDTGGNFFYAKPQHLGGKYTLFSSVRDRAQQGAHPLRGEIPLSTARRYLLLPEVDPRIRELALRVTEHDKDIWDKARSIERFLKSNYRYSLNIDMPRGADPLSYFLFYSRAGHCEFFACAQAVMLRSLGIPARLVNGFRRGEFNAWGHDFIVRESDAHSWVEAYFQGIGWVEFDPTPPDPARASSQWIAMLRHLFDAIDLFWTTEILTYDFWKQVSFFRSVRDNLSGVSATADRWARDWMQAPEDWWNAAKRALLANSHSRIGWLVVIATLTLLLLRFRFTVLAAIASLLPQSRSKNVEVLVISRCYLRFLRKLEARGFSRKYGETAWELVARIDREDLHSRARRFTDLYYRLRYGPGTGDSIRDLMMALDQV